MAYNPVDFDRGEYLEHAEMFEGVRLEYPDREMSEFNDDASDLAFELAYSRYHIAKTEAERDALRQEVARYRNALEVICLHESGGYGECGDLLVESVVTIAERALAEEGK